MRLPSFFRHPASSSTLSDCNRYRFAEALERRVLLASVPDGFSDSEVIAGLNSPTAMEIAPDGRIFVADQQGTISIVQDNQKTTFTTLPQVNFQVERGLLGITLDPNFTNNHFVYVYYTTDAGGLHNRISRMVANGNTAGPEQILVDLPPMQATNHLGGALHFGADGKLYVGSGDHTGGIVAQHIDNIFGKLLRFNADGSIPTDNPFYNQTTGVNRAIWAIGLRNPFTFGVQPGSGRIFINDVGDETFEEIDDGTPGANYGWPASEGPNNTNGFTAPIHWYNRTGGFGCAISGGTFYNPEVGNFPSSYVGDYFFGDLCGGWVDVYDPATDSATRFGNNFAGAVDFDVSADGSLYYLERGPDFGQGRIGKIRFVTVGAPNVSNQPHSQSITRGSGVTFSVAATGAGELNYQWQFNGDDIDGANSPSYTIDSVQPENAGGYRVIVSNDIGSAASNTATLTVVNVPVGAAPTAKITSPVAGTKFHYGQKFSFSGIGLDAEDGALGPSRFTWRVDYHTGSVIRPFVPETVGVRSGTFTIPDETPFKETNVFYRITLTVRDSDGQTTTVTRDLVPVVAKLTLKASLDGVTLTLDGTPHDAPYGVNNVAGLTRMLGAPSTVTFKGMPFAFDGWSDGGDITHVISAPASNTTYIARFRQLPVNSTRGLSQTIYNNRNRTGTIVTGNVANIDFDYGAGKPNAAIAPDTFFIRWRGKVQPQFSETYTFYADADDAVRLFVDGQLLVDTWDGGSAGVEQSGTIDLVAGQKYDLRFDYYENTGDAHAHLLWSSDSTPKAVIPRNRLYSSLLPTTLTPTADSYVQGGTAADDNFGTRSLLLTKSAAGDAFDRESYLKFDLSALGTSISSAKLRVFGRLSDVTDTNIVTALYSAPKAKWSETGIRFDGRPATTSKAIAAATVSNDTAQWYEFDLTNFLRAEKAAGRTVLTFVLRNLTNSSTYTLFNSRNATTNGPQLQVWT